VLVVHLIRKPLSEGNVASNVLRWGCGALNIQDSRVGSESVFTRGKRPQHQAGEKYGSGALLKTPRDGRWPANLILEHKPGCRCVGVAQGAGYLINRWDDGSKPFGGGAGHPYTSEQQVERVAIWECVEGCPVADLDSQGGTSTTGKRSEKSKGALVENTIWGTDNHQSQEYPDDKGGAARFFKQVQHHGSDEP